MRPKSQSLVALVMMSASFGFIAAPEVGRAAPIGTATVCAQFYCCPDPNQICAIEQDEEGNIINVFTGWFSEAPCPAA